MNKIFIWKNFYDWQNELVKLSYGLLSKKLINKIKQNYNDIYTDDCGALEKEIMCDENDLINYQKFINGFRKTYDYILTFHASRPISKKDYLDKGIQIVPPKILNEKFIELFFNDRFPEITEENIKNAIIGASEYHFSNGLYVTLDDREFINFSGHYLIYGSEYLTSLAVHLNTNKNYDYRQYLRTIGKPTIFIIKLPIEMVDDDDLRCLYSIAIRSWIFNYANNRKRNFSVDFSFFINESIPPEYIIGFKYPKKIRDWLHNGMLYDVKNNSHSIYIE